MGQQVQHSLSLSMNIPKQAMARRAFSPEEHAKRRERQNGTPLTDVAAVLSACIQQKELADVLSINQRCTPEKSVCLQV